MLKGKLFDANQCINCKNISNNCGKSSSDSCDSFEYCTYKSDFIIKMIRKKEIDNDTHILKYNDSKQKDALFHFVDEFQSLKIKDTMELEIEIHNMESITNSFLTFDEARTFAQKQTMHGYFKHEDMPLYYNIYGVLRWLHENRNIEAINRMLNEKRWQIRTDADVKILGDKCIAD